MKFEKVLDEAMTYDKKLGIYYDTDNESIKDYKKSLKNPKKAYSVWHRIVRTKI